MSIDQTFSELPPFPGRLVGKTALVTGAASGLGAAIAVRLAEEGANVVLTDIGHRRSTGTGLKHRFLKRFALTHDVSSPDHWKEAMDRTVAHFGRLDVLVNNAGITTMGSIEELEVDAFRHELDIDVIGVFLGCKSAVANMKEHGGSIINMSSSAGTQGLFIPCWLQRGQGSCDADDKVHCITLCRERLWNTL